MSRRVSQDGNIMALEALLPSEVARLVYGYLIDERCTETAKLFLNESPNLEECRSVLSHGRHFTTRVCGHALLDILEKFCLLNSIIQEKIDKFDNSDKLKHCGDLIGQIKLLVDEYKGHNFLINVNESMQTTSIIPSESPTKSRRKRFSSNKNEDKSMNMTQVSNEGLQTKIQINFNQVENSTAVEATLLKNLPGYVNDLETEKCEVDKLKSPKKSKEIVTLNNVPQDKTIANSLKLQETQNENKNIPKQRCNGLNQNIDITISKENLKRCTNSEVQICKSKNKIDKSIMTDSTEERLKNCTNSEVQTSDIGSFDSELSSSNNCIKLLRGFTSELLNRSEIHDKIAGKINTVLEPIKSNSNEKSCERAPQEINKSFIAEYNKAVKTVLNKTENDPEFLEILNAVIPSREENFSTEDEVDTDIENVNKLEEKVNSTSKQKVSKNNINKEVVLITNDQSKLKSSQSESINGNNKRTSVESTNCATDPIVADQVSLSKNSKCFTNPAIIHQIHSTKGTNCFNNATTVEQVDLKEKDSACSTIAVQNSLGNSKDLLNPLESPILQQKPAYKSDNFFTHNNTLTSTPIKTCTAVQNFDTCDWFSTEDLHTPNIVCYKEDTAACSKASFSCGYTSCETIVTTTTSYHLSPIISKDSCNVAERITGVNRASTNAMKDQTLDTPDIAYLPRNVGSSNITSLSPVNNVPKNKTPTLQKSSEVIDELLNLQTSEKSNGNVDNLSQLLKDNSEYNRYFSIESIMLYGIDSNTSALQTALTVPEIEVEDSITISGIGLSPFIKIQTKSDESVAVIEKNKEKMANYINKELNESAAVTERNNEEIPKSKSATNTSTDIITGHTPKTLLENRSKNNRLSLSTPKKTSNYVRALNFDTPVIRSQSESKVKDVTLSPQTIKKNLMNSCKSSLFQSPAFTNSEIIEQKQCNDALREIVPAATNPKPMDEDICSKSTNNIEKGTNEIDNKTLKEPTSVKEKKGDIESTNIKKDSTIRRSWDSELRKYLSQDNTQKRNETAQRSHRKRSKEETAMKSTPKKSKKGEKSTSKNAKKDEKKVTPKKSKKSEKSKDIHDKKIVEAKKTEVNPITSNQQNVKIVKDPLEMLLSDSINDDETVKETDVMKLASEEMENLSKLSKNESTNIIDKNNESNITEKMQEDEKSMTKVFDTAAESLSTNCFPKKDPRLKKHSEKVQESTLENKILVDYEKIEEQLSIITNTDVPKPSTQKANVMYDQVSIVECGKVVQKKYARIKTLETNITKPSPMQGKKLSPLSSFSLELETPRKDENTLQIPPTPQVLSPGSGSLMMLNTKLSEDSRTLQSLVATPLECPLTPNIVLTPPKTVEGNAKNALQKCDNSTYYQPTPTTFVVKSTKSEITQFEVIKENLLKDSKITDSKESLLTDTEIQNKQKSPFKDSDTNVAEEDLLKNNEIKDSKENVFKDDKPQSDFENVVDKVISPDTSIFCSENKTDLEIRNSDSSSSSSSSSDSCDSCSSSSSSDDEDDYPIITLENQEVEKEEIVVTLEDQIVEKEEIVITSEDQEIQKEIVIDNQSEVSPNKVFSINKTDKEIADCVQETPAKDENLEVDIFDTPNVFKPTDNPMNLNAKISQIMILKEQEEVGKLQSKSKPKVIKVQRILPKIITKPPTKLIKALPLNIQMKALEVKNESSRIALLQRIKIEKSEEEIAKAIESIIPDEMEKFNKSQEEFNKSTNSILPSPIDKNDTNTVELVKAIESITKTDYEIYHQHSGLEKVSEINESSSEANLQLVFEEDHAPAENNVQADSKVETYVKLNESGSSHMHNTRSKSRQKLAEEMNISNGLSDCYTPYQSTYVFDEHNYKRRRRKAFSQDDLTFDCKDEEGELMYVLAATPLDILYNNNPPRKKRTKKSQVVKKEIYFDDTSQDSLPPNTNNNVPISNNKDITTDEKETDKVNNKRKRASGENDQVTNVRKRKKNMFVLQ